MSKSKIQWTERTWNPVAGCSMVSPGCANCYAMHMAHRLSGMHVRKYAGLTVARKGQVMWTGDIRLDEETLQVPMRTRKPRTYFVNSMSDLFHEYVPFEFIDKVYTVMAKCPQHTFQVLTKRPQRAAMWYGDRTPHHTPNVWLGVSVEDQARADERIPILLQTPAAVRFLSCEPLIGPLDLRAVGYMQGNALFVGDEGGWDYTGSPRQMLSWVIVGGESGQHARPCNVEWVRSIMQQCKAAKVPVFVKQLGRNPVSDGCKYYNATYCTHCSGHEHKCLDYMLDNGFTLADPKGGDMTEWPEELRVREMPEVQQ